VPRAATFGERRTQKAARYLLGLLLARQPQQRSRQTGPRIHRQKMREKHTHILAVNKCIAQFFGVSFTRTPRLAATHYFKVSHFSGWKENLAPKRTNHKFFWFSLREQLVFQAGRICIIISISAEQQRNHFYLLTITRGMSLKGK
jgi:hypothetical protein